MTTLAVRRLDAHYGDFQALYGINLDVAPGAIVAIIGANSAGKTTLLSAIAGLIHSPRDGVMFDRQPIGGLPAHEIVRRGVTLVPEGRMLFPSLTVEENLLIGAYAERPGPWSLARVYELFPSLRPRRRSPSTLLSGGQQQMVAIGRALMSNPRLLLCDEISLGLAPVVIREIYAKLPEISAQGCSVLMVEQDIHQALAAASYLYCLQEGRVSLQGRPAELTVERISQAYFGS